MVISTYYNKKEKTLMITTSVDYEEERYEEDGNITKIFNENNELIGINIFEFNDPNLEDGLVQNDKVHGVIGEFFPGAVEAPFIVGKVLEMEKHPKSEKLNICQVDLGDEITQIVCGASNVGAGIKVIVAKLGAVMPSGMEIIPSKLLGVESDGMICSLYELGKSDESGNGIAILDENSVVGSPY